MEAYIIMATKSKARIYDEVSQPQIEEGIKFIRELNLSKGDKVLDMGCGTGHLTKYIADIVGLNGEVVGIDPDAERIKIAKEKYKEVSNLQFYVGSSAIGFPHDNESYYDVHISTNAFHWVPSDEKIVYIQKAHQCLKHGGKLAILCGAKKIVEARGFHSLSQEGYLDLFQEIGHFDNVVVRKTLQRFKFKSAAEFVHWYRVSTHQEPDPDVVSGFYFSEDDGRVTFIVHSFAITACNH